MALPQRWITGLTKAREEAEDPNSWRYNPEFTLKDIIASGGLTPQQRAMMTSAMSRQLGRAAEGEKEAMSRRIAAQGIGGTGLANAALSGAQGNLLSAYQQGLSNIEQTGMNSYLQALYALYNARQNKELAEMQKEGQGGLGGLLGGVLGTFGGGIAGGAADWLSGQLF